LTQQTMADDQYRTPKRSNSAPGPRRASSVARITPPQASVLFVGEAESEKSIGVAESEESNKRKRKRFNVPPKGFRNFHHVVVRPNPALPPVSPRAFSPAAGSVYHTHNGLPLTDEEWDWHVKCGYKPPTLAHYFTNNINPKTGTGFLQAARAGFKVIGLAASTSTSKLIKSHVVTKHSGQFYTYNRYNLIAVIAIVCTRAFLGYHRSGGNMGNG
jgi:hypothetical protein